MQPLPKQHTAQWYIQHNLRTPNLCENFEVLKKCPRKPDYLIFEMLLVKKKRPDFNLIDQYSISYYQSWLVVLIDSRLTLSIHIRPKV